MPAYFAPDVKCEGPARDLPAFNRIRPEKLWKTGKSVQNGKAGTVAFIGDEPPPNGTSGWVECADGLLYLPGWKLPKPQELARQIQAECIPYTTARGAALMIPIAAATPRQLVFGSDSLGDFALDWVKRAFALFDRIAAKEDLRLTSPDVLSLVVDALSHVYAVTPEMLNDLGWITSADVDPILCCIMGSDPKAVQPAGGSSPSPAGA